jgi:hypothetical protein
MKLSYNEKLKDPRWQKRRLEILNRDEWFCQSCGNKERTLHVHHRLYSYNTEPWDYPDSNLVTLCHICHDKEDKMDEVLKELCLFLKSKFLVDEVRIIKQGFEKHTMMQNPIISVAVFREFFSSVKECKKMLKHVCKRFGYELKNGIVQPNNK